jgi:hypothetical protein
MKKNNRGFTVVEILFAFALLAVGLAEVVVIMGQGQTQDTASGKNVVALTLAKEQLESIKNLPYAGVNSVALTNYGAPYTDYAYQVVVTPVGALPGQIKDVTVTVSYVLAAQSINPKISLETYIGNY